MNNKKINQLAETMNVNEFISELETHNIEFEFDEIENIMDYNEGMVNVIIGDSAFLFIDGKLCK